MGSFRVRFFGFWWTCSSLSEEELCCLSGCVLCTLPNQNSFLSNPPKPIRARNCIWVGRCIYSTTTTLNGDFWFGCYCCCFSCVLTSQLFVMTCVAPTTHSLVSNSLVCELLLFLATLCVIVHFPTTTTACVWPSLLLL